MGISHEYHSTSHRARHGGVSGKLRLAGAVLAILVLAYAITAILENGASAKDAPSEPVASGIAQDILAPLPMQGEAADSDSSGDSTAPDGVHLSAGNGYGTWLTYLRNHAKYSANNSWTMGSVYSAQ